MGESLKFPKSWILKTNRTIQLAEPFQSIKYLSENG